MRSRAIHEYRFLSVCRARRDAARRGRFRTFSYFLFVNKQSGAARRGVVRAGGSGGGETINHFN